MSPELIAILAVGVALAGLVLNGQRGVNARLDGIDKRIDGIDKRMDSIDERLRAVETALAEVKGQLTIVRARPGAHRSWRRRLSFVPPGHPALACCSLTVAPGWKAV